MSVKIKCHNHIYLWWQKTHIKICWLIRKTNQLLLLVKVELEKLKPLKSSWRIWHRLAMDSMVPRETLSIRSQLLKRQLNV